MTKPKTQTRTKSDATIIGQLSEPTKITSIKIHPGVDPAIERSRLTVGAMEERIANRIRNYWAERGYYIAIAVQEIPFIRKNGKAEAVTVRAARSNLVNGLPVGYNELSLGIASYRRQIELLREVSQ
jgi:hypothetical protein